MLLQTINVASIAVLSTLGVTYVLDKIKDRQEKNLREEMKDRMEATLKESTERIRALELQNDQLQNQLVNREQIEKLVNDKLEQLENGKIVGDAKSRALTLKVRANQASNPSQISGHNMKRGMSMYNPNDESKNLIEGKDPLKDDMDSLKTELISELKEIKKTISDSTQHNQSLLTEIKKFNQTIVNQIKSQQIQGTTSMAEACGINNTSMITPKTSVSFGDAKGLMDVKVEEDQKSEDEPEDLMMSSLSNQKPQEIQPKIEEKKFLSIELTEEQKQDIKSKVDEMISKYADSNEKKNVVKILGFPLSNMLTDAKKNRIDLNNGIFKNLNSKVPGNFSTFLVDIGFTKKSDTLHEFELPKADGEISNPDNVYSSNQKVIEQVIAQFEEIKKIE
eukprot:403353953